MLLPGLLENEKRWKERVSGCNSVAVKTLGLPYPSLLEVQSFHPNPTCLAPIWIYMRVNYCGTYNASKSKWHIVCIFLFYFKICNLLLYIPWICSNLICFKVQMTFGVQLGLDKSIKSSYVRTGGGFELSS